jgi:hypothetical protein
MNRHYPNFTKYIESLGISIEEDLPLILVPFFCEGCTEEQQDLLLSTSLLNGEGAKKRMSPLYPERSGREFAIMFSTKFLSELGFKIEADYQTSAFFTASMERGDFLAIMSCYPTDKGLNYNVSFMHPKLEEYHHKLRQAQAPEGESVEQRFKRALLGDDFETPEFTGDFSGDDLEFSVTHFQTSFRSVWSKWSKLLS